jgi:hypothetical protein
VTFLAGVWLLLAPFVLDYAPAPDGVGAYWNDLVVGGAIAVLALVDAVAPAQLVWFRFVNAVLGGWLIAAPFALDYEARAYALRAIGNDVAVGLLVLVTALASAVTAYQRRKREPSQDATVR